MNLKKLTTIEKAKWINDDPCIYGTFAEIGAGQEVARFFFQAGLASHTIAKTMSAYDMKFSDAIYGAEKSYVCKPRVDKMLDREFALLEERLGEREEASKYFVFADTVATGSQRRNTAGHGWAGVKFQTDAGKPPSKVVVHVRLLGKKNLDQQFTLGKIGVNLLHACYSCFDDPKALVSSLGDDVDSHEVEIDSISFSGPAFENVNNRMMQIELVKQGLTSAVMFNSKARISSPSELLYKKHVIATRGTFRPITRVKENMLEAALKHFVKTKNVDESQCVTVCEMSTHHLIGEADHKIDEADFLSRVDMLAGLGYTVMVSNHKDDFSLVEYLVRYSAFSRALVLGSHNLHKILDKNYYKHVVGGLLEALGLMLSHNTSLFVFPITTKDGQLSVENVKLSEENRLLLNYLLTSGLVEELENDSDSIYISPSKICEMIKAKDEISHLVPASVVELISARKLYSE